ncbi:MAG: aldehyde-activating protein [Candidatus Sericytochromatia bacterium]
MNELKCHCGNIQINVKNLKEVLTSCNCSVCSRYGALWGNYEPDEIKINIQNEFKNYSWSDKNIEFIFCASCGCITHYITTEKVEKATIGINFRMLNEQDLSKIKIRRFDGAKTWKFLD